MAYHVRALFASGALLLVSSGAALAASGVATTNVNVRSGPGEESRIIDVLPQGETVNLIGCDEEWCEISMGRDGTGYALAELLDIRGRPPFVRFGAPSRTVVIEEDDPVVIRGLEIGGYWDSRPYYYRDGYYYWGGRWYGSRPGVGGWRDRSWRRWDDRDRSWRNRGDRDRPGDTRGGRTNRPPRVDDPRWVDRPGDTRGGRTNRPPSIDPRGGRGDDDRGRGDRDRGDRGERFRGPGVDRSDPGGGRSGGGRGGGMERSGDGRMSPMERVESRPEPRDRGDRMGLDGGRGRGGDGGGRGGDGGGRGGGGGGREGRGDR